VRHCNQWDEEAGNQGERQALHERSRDRGRKPRPRIERAPKNGIEEIGDAKRLIYPVL
jgi:hypothetical protein